MNAREEQPDVVFSLVAVTRRRGGEIRPWIQRLAEQADELGQPWELIVVVDGPEDADVSAVREIARRDPSVRLVALAETVGLTRATLAGLDFTRGRAVICVDPAGWTPPSEIPQLVARWREGFSIVAPAQIDEDAPAAPEGEEDTEGEDRGMFRWCCRRGWRQLNRHLRLALARPRDDVGLGLMLLDARVVCTLRTHPLASKARRHLLDGPWRVSCIRPVAGEGSGEASYLVDRDEQAAESSETLLREAWRAVMLASAGVACVGALGMVLGPLVWLISWFRFSSGFVGFLVMTLLGALGVVVALQMRQISQLRSQIADWPRYAVAETEGFEIHRPEDVPTAPPAEAIEQAISIYT
jgi:hypothetical protein